MDLNGTQRRQLHEALMSAFPSHSALKQWVDFELDENLESIASNANLSTTVYELITWAKAHNRVEDLIEKALLRNPHNVKLSLFASEVGLACGMDTTSGGNTAAQHCMPTASQQTISSFTSLCTIIPLSTTLPVHQAPAHLVIPAGFHYLGKLDGLQIEHFYRERDGHVMLRYPAQSDGSRTFLIDKYAITAQQVSMFLNHLVSLGQAHVDRLAHNGITCCIDKRGHVLALDAQEQWNSLAPSSRPLVLWGIMYQDDQWQPLAGSELLPATLITWWGAQAYSFWAHGQSIDTLGRSAVYLPTNEQWLCAAAADPLTKRQRFYPWGDYWENKIVNYAGSWAGCEIYGTVSLQDWKTNAPETYRRMQPLPVSALSEGRSPIGCVQLIGNVWEWCANVSPENPEKRIIKGGACNSPQEYCIPDYTGTWLSHRANEYIGFRCVFPL